jgi:hypothetical protein
MLRDRTTYLKFDDYTSEAIKIDNGIGQGDPLSMVLYQYYNADILDITSHPKENAIAYVDDALVMAAGVDFTVTHQMLTNILNKRRGGSRVVHLPQLPTRIIQTCADRLRPQMQQK